MALKAGHTEPMPGSSADPIDRRTRSIDVVFSHYYPHGSRNRPTTAQIRAVLTANAAIERMREENGA